MKTDFKSLLDMGSERAVADMAVAALEEKPEEIRALLDLCFLEEYPLSMRAARALQLYCESHPNDLNPYLEESVDKMLQSKIDGVRRNFLKIYAHFIDIDNIREPGQLLNTCFLWLQDPGQKPGLRIHAMDLIYKLGIKEPGLHHELKVSLELIDDNSEPSIRNCARKMLFKLNRSSNINQ